jgi:peptidoglycan/xylan/chitin deacetylase (PgdA/CDA1 family)
MRSALASLVLFLISLPASSQKLEAKPEQKLDRQVCITIDDLPAAAANQMSGPEIVEMTTRLLATLKQYNVPAVGFVNERKLYYKMNEVNDTIKALSLWLDNGFELGNHTFAHTSLNRAGLKEFEDAVIQGEPVLRLLLAQHGLKLRYFRHPYLDTGRDLQTRLDAEAFLTARGYRIAPVTLDAWDWNFAGVYDDARRRGDQAVQREVVAAYLAYHEAVFDYFEKLSRSLIGYEPKQILLLHGNWLEAEHIGQLLDMMKKRGYRFITLEDALSDDAYGLPDTWIGEEGRGWIEHWAITRGQPPLGAPVFPAAIESRVQSLPKPLQPQPPQ